MPEVDLVLGNEEKLSAEAYRLPAAGVKARVSDIMQAKALIPHPVEGIGARVRAFLKVQTGCDHRCTFCIIPFGRGPSRSMPVADAVVEARRMREAGAAEIVLTGVDLTAYGVDLPGRPTLGRLVRAILKAVPELPRLRLSSLDAVEVDDELLLAVAEEERLMPHFHLSLQHGDDLILKRMKRRHSRADAVALCDRLRALRPDAVFGADLIAGFPTETEAMFARSLDLVEACGLTFVHVFPFSPRPETPAARMPQVPAEAVRDRARRLREAGARAMARHHAGERGKIVPVLFEGLKLGRTPQFTPVRMPAEVPLGAIRPVEITGTRGDALEGRLAA